ncbi:MAG: hypothetical protein ACRYGF_07610, partial [Janthinobacterium lividum]
LTRGGFPVGALAELVGPACSGRTTAALSFLANVTAKGNVCAWIDVSDALDPEAAAANGVDLQRLLWIRCGTGTTQAAANKSAPATKIIREPSQSKVGQPSTGGGSPHPRSEGQGMSEAIQTLLTVQQGSAAVQPRRKDRSIGTPGAPNRPLIPHHQHLREREEQVSTDRLPARRGWNLQAAAVAKPALLHIGQQASGTDRAAFRKSAKPEWSALDQALRSADLLLQAGGFQAIVLDLGSTPAEQAWRIPMATWFRFRAACERSRVSLLLLTQHPCARSSAELVLRMQPGAHVFQGAAMVGMAFQGELDRQRQHRPEDAQTSQSNVIAMRKAPRSERSVTTSGQWQAVAPWMRAQ